MLDMINQHSVPSIWINSKQEHDCVHPDDIEAGQRATEHLLKLGHRRIAFICYSGINHYSVTDRLCGYEQVMSQTGFKPQVILPENCDVALADGGAIPRKDRRAVTKRLLSAPDRPTAIITNGRTTATPIYCVAIAMGLKVPENLSIVTFSDKLENETDMAITTWLTPFYEMGRVSVEMLLGKIANPTRLLPFRALEFGFAEGQTCAPSPS